MRRISSRSRHAPDFLMNDEDAHRREHHAHGPFLPLPFGADAVNRRGDENYNVMARLKPGVTMDRRSPTST